MIEKSCKCGRVDDRSDVRMIVALMMLLAPNCNDVRDRDHGFPHPPVVGARTGNMIGMDQQQLPQIGHYQTRESRNGISFFWGMAISKLANRLAQWLICC